MNPLRKNPHFFGVRHLSPGGAYQLLKFLEEIKPTAVLVEGLSDASSEIDYFTGPDTVLPLAILAYTTKLPVRTLLYPFAEYSPEYQAIIWAKRNQSQVEFIDLPSDVFLQIEYMDPEKLPESEPRFSVYQKWAELAGEEDHEAYWERSFEQNMTKDAYRLAAAEFGQSLRALSMDSKPEQAKNLIREAFMRRKIRECMSLGHQADKIVVVTGAYHTPALGLENEPMTDAEFDKLPRIETKLTIMPYSNYRLSSKSGYGAGNNAPNYYKMMWDYLINNDADRLPAAYLTTIAAYIRSSGTPCSAAGVIEGVCLARALAALQGSGAPVLKDLRDAAVTCLGNGQLSVVAEAIAHTEIGTAIGSLPEGVSRTSLQADFYAELSRLKLEKYKSVVAMDLELDLRENRRVKSSEAAYLDLNRSCFLHRLRILKVSFQEWKLSNQQTGTWAEKWTLHWTPEAEIELVESALKGETIEQAVSFVFKEQLERADKIEEAAEVITEACRCGMLESMEEARLTLKNLAVDTGAFCEVAAAAAELSMIISYGDIRKFDASLLVPLLEQLFLRGTLLLVDAANCNSGAALEIVEAVKKLNNIAVEHGGLVDDARWLKTLSELSDRDDRNPQVSGYACAVLLERGVIDAETLSGEVSRRLSPGIAADLGAGWFEGLSLRNRYALLARMGLWEQLDNYVASLDAVQFRRALVFLRRAFGDFGVSEKRTICENLGEIWGVNTDDATDFLQRELNDEEEEVLSELNEFDFGDI